MYCYKDIQFKTRLEARWSEFFNLAGWKWWANPEEVNNWAPDFKVKFDCSHSECGGHHTLLVSILPLSSIKEFGAHPCLHHNYREGFRVDGGAALGTSPSVSSWDIMHGSGGGNEDIHSRVHNADELWLKADQLLVNDAEIRSGHITIPDWGEIT